MSAGGRRGGSRGRARRGRPAPAPVAVQTEHALAEVIADPHRPSSRTLLLDGREAGQVDLQDPRALAFAYMRRIADLIDAFRPPGTAIDVLHVGGGACALPRYVDATRPRSHQLVFELDPGVVALARAHLGLRAFPRLRVRVGDAADLIGACEPRSFDLVIGDAFDGPHVPARLSTAAFAAQVRRVLRPSGQLIASIVHPFRDRGRFAGPEPEADFVLKGSYFGRVRFDGIEERDGKEMHFAGWSQPLENYMALLEQAGFAVVSLREPWPDVRQRPDMARWCRVPLFLWLKARPLP